MNDSHPHRDATLDPAEIDRFARLASEWWDANGKFRTLHRIGPRPTVVAGEVVVREIGWLACTFDHRVVDGARASTFLLEVIDYYFLSVRIWRARSLVSEYVLDLRYVDPELYRSRHVAWRWILATLSFAALSGIAVWLAVRSSWAPT